MPVLDPNFLTLVEFLKNLFKSGLFLKIRPAGNKKRLKSLRMQKQKHRLKVSTKLDQTI